MPRIKTSTALLIREERKRVMNRLDTLQQLLHDATARQALESHKFSVSFEAKNLSISFSSGIDLETDDLLSHFSKLWLCEEPDESFLRATHPAVVKLRQDGIPQWKQSTRWNHWSEWLSVIKYEELRRVGLDRSLFPHEKDCRHLCQTYIMSCNWYYELLTEAECNEALAEMHCYQHLGLTPTSSEQWTRIALVLAICRLTLSGLTWVGTTGMEQFITKRCITMRNWCDLSVRALCQAGFDQNPTVEALRVLLILTSTVSVAVNVLLSLLRDCGLLMGTPQMRKLHRLAIDASERLNLHRDPPAYLSPKEKDDRRRMWWTVVAIDSYSSTAAKISYGPLGLQNSDTKFPAPRQLGKATYAHTAGKLAYRDLRSAQIRFEIGKLHNRYLQLLTPRRPLETLSEIWKLDKDLVALEASVLPEQRLLSDLDLNNFSQWQSQPLEMRDDVLRYAQQTFYVAFWHMRAMVHRGLLYRDQSASPVNLDAHRDIVSRSSYCMLHLYRSTKLPTAYTASIASAALTVLFELLYQPAQRYDRERRAIVSDCLSRLQTYPSPVIGRACQVIEYFLEPIQPHVEISTNYAAGSNERQNIDPSTGFVEDPSRVTTDFAQDSYREASAGGNKTSKAEVSLGLSVCEIMQTHTFGVVPPNSSDKESGAECTHHSFELKTEQPTTNLRNQIPDMSTTNEPSRVCENPDTVQDSAIKELLDFVRDNHSIYMQKNSGILDVSVDQTGHSDLLMSSQKSSKEYDAGTHFDATSPSTISHACDDVNLACPFSNPTNSLNTSFSSYSKSPMIEVANPIPEFIPNDLSRSLDQTGFSQNKDTTQDSAMDETFDPLLSGDSQSLWGKLGIRHGSSFSNGSKLPSSNLFINDHLSHREYIPTSTMINSDCGSNNLKENEIPRRDPASCFPSVDTSSAKQVNYYQASSENLGATPNLERGILNEAGQSGEPVPFFGDLYQCDLYQYIKNNSFPHIHNSCDIQLNNLTKETQ